MGKNMDLAIKAANMFGNKRELSLHKINEFYLVPGKRAYPGYHDVNYHALMCANNNLLIPLTKHISYGRGLLNEC